MLSKQKKKRRVRGAPKTIRELIKEADTHFSRYIRIRDSERQSDGSWMGLCIDCGRRVLVMDAQGHWVKSANIGHYVSRSHFSLRYDEENCNMQSAWCNAWRDKLSMMDGYTKGLDEKYGDGTAKRLKQIGTSLHKFDREELLDIIADSKTELDFILKEAKRA